ncbi:ribonuclease HII [Pelagicoccus sp. SDUM812003]|uniref:ribonuclease HII n=1 Tax=Pelagicoccus sp. SDUM812003 TaxID=3041267 RepID=UPI00280DC8D5|nr:ribonuclease HII [Pelagicoccus sp. SDUM812003]MDQ8203104.1 ribonuclease HII [Pelagicoccus sp. SDUM812003]
MKSYRLRAFDRKQIRRGVSGLIGVDEAGRGALAGPVVAAAVAARESFYDSEWCKRHSSSINDSKLLSFDEREELYGKLRWLEREGRLVIGVGRGSVEEIEDQNILGATQTAMRRAVEEILQKAEISPHDPDPLFAMGNPEAAAVETLSQWLILVDGKPMKLLGYPHEALVKGDSKALCIAMASIVAKVTRDRIMMALDCEFPHYDLASSKGYATALHRSAILEKGATSIHRPLFLRKLLEGASACDEAQEEFGF